MSTKRPSLLRFFSTAIFSVFVSVMLLFMGAPLVRALRIGHGPLRFWMTGIAAFTILYFFQLQPLGFLFLSSWIAVGLYSEIEANGRGTIWTAGLSVLVASGVFFGGMHIWAGVEHLDLLAILTEGIESVAKQIASSKESSVSLPVDAKMVIHQIPSAVILLVLSSLAFGLMLERKACDLIGVEYRRVSSHIRLHDFRLPDIFVWITMFSFLLSFLKIQPESVGIVSANIFNVMAGLYFFQGLAVLEVSFLAFRVGNFTRALVYFFIVGQLFLLLSAVGFIDYWLDLRARMRRIRTPGNNQNNGEHI